MAREILVPAAPENREGVGVLDMADRGELEFEKRGLARIDVHGDNAGRRIERIVERVAAAAGDDQHAVAGGRGS
jgi:hypothetical protein